VQSAPACGGCKKGAEEGELSAEEKKKKEGIGLSRGGKNTKIHAVVDGLGNPVELTFTEGNISDSKEAVPLLEKVSEKVDMSGSTVLGDKAYGSKEIREFIESTGASYCIPPKSNAKEPWDVDYHHYKERHLVECFFNKLKQFRHIATRYDKLLSRFKSFVFLASVLILCK